MSSEDKSTHLVGAASSDNIENRLAGASSAGYVEAHLLGAISPARLEYILVEPPTADRWDYDLLRIPAEEQREIIGSYVEEQSSDYKIESCMIDLYSFMTKTVKSFHALNPNGYIDVFQRMEFKYGLLDSESRKKTKLRILIGVFDKYLNCRLPKVEFTRPCERAVILFVMESIVSASCHRMDDFTTISLWNLMETAYAIRRDPYSVMENEITLWGTKLPLDYFITQLIRKISYFGEFLYFCAAVTIFKGSPLDNLIGMCNIIEIQVVESIRRNVTPELGISTFLIYRNWISDSFPNTKENMDKWIRIQTDKQALGNFHHAYRNSLKKIKRRELLYNYLKRFLIFLGSEASSAHRYFDLNVLSSFGFLNGLNNENFFLNLDGINLYLIKLLQFFVDVLLYLYDANSDSICFKEIPKFFNVYWSRTYCKSYLAAAYVYDATQLIDFVFVDQFHNRFASAYYDICVAVGKLVIERFDFPHVSDPIITRFCLFPFFDVRNEE